MTARDDLPPAGTPLICSDERHRAEVASLTERLANSEAELAGARATIEHMSQAMSWISGHDRQGLDHLDEAQREARARESAVKQARAWAARARTAGADLAAAMEGWNGEADAHAKRLAAVRLALSSHHGQPSLAKAVQAALDGQRTPALLDQDSEPAAEQRPTVEVWSAEDRWMWQCIGTEHCDGDVGVNLPGSEAAWAAVAEHVTKRHTEEHRLHLTCSMPGWEYATTQGPRKQWDDADTPPDGDGWEPNTARGSDGWERFDYHEESYWRRQVGGAS